MRKSFIISLGFFIIFGVTRVFSLGEDASSMSYVARDMNGEKRWQANSEIRKKEGDIYIFTERGNGVYSSFKEPISWVADMEFKDTEKNIIPLKLVKRVFDKNGDIIRLEKQDYDPSKNSVICFHKDFPKNISTTKEFEFTKDPANRLLLGLYVQKMLMKGKTNSKIQMISEEPACYNIDLTVIKTEIIDINGSKRSAYKVQIDPKLGILDVVKVFFPKAYAWHSSEPNFNWLRYEGLEGGVGSAKVEVIIKQKRVLMNG